MIQEHRHDVVSSVRAAAGMRRAVEAGREARTAVLTRSSTDAQPHRVRRRGACARRWPNVEEDNWSGTPSTPSRAADYLADRKPFESGKESHRRWCSFFFCFLGL